MADNPGSGSLGNLGIILEVLGVNKVMDDLNKVENSFKKTGKQVKQTKQEIRRLGAASTKGARGILELSRGAEDAAVGFGVNGFQGAIRGSLNNLTQFSFIAGGPALGALAGFAAAGVAMGAAIVNIGSKSKDAAKELDVLTESTNRLFEALGRIPRDVKFGGGLRELKELRRIEGRDAAVESSKEDVAKLARERRIAQDQLKEFFRPGIGFSKLIEKLTPEEQKEVGRKALGSNEFIQRIQKSKGEEKQRLLDLRRDAVLGERDPGAGFISVAVERKLRFAEFKSTVALRTLGRESLRQPGFLTKQKKFGIGQEVDFNALGLSPERLKEFKADKEVNAIIDRFKKLNDVVSKTTVELAKIGRVVGKPDLPAFGRLPESPEAERARKEEEEIDEISRQHDIQRLAGRAKILDFIKKGEEEAANNRAKETRIRKAEFAGLAGFAKSLLPADAQRQIKLDEEIAGVRSSRFLDVGQKASLTGGLRDLFDLDEERRDIKGAPKPSASFFGVTEFAKQFQLQISKGSQVSKENLKLEQINEKQLQVMKKMDTSLKKIPGLFTIK